MLFILILNGQHFRAIVSWWDRYKRKFKLSFLCASNVSITCFTCFSIFPKPKQSCIPSCMRFKGVIVSLMLSVWKKRFIFYKRSVICKAENVAFLLVLQFQNIKFLNHPPCFFLCVSLSLSLFPHPSFAKPDQFFFSPFFLLSPLFFWLALLHPLSPPPLSLSPPSLSLSPPPLSLPPSLPLSRSTPSVFFFSLFLFLSVAPSLWPLSSHTRFGADSLFIAPVVLSLWQPSWRPGRQGAIFGAPL